MMKLLSLVKQTSAYKVISADKKAGKLSHAYLIICSDQYYLDQYLRVLAMLITCNNIEPCITCRSCSLIAKDSFADVDFYPKGRKEVLSEDINSIVSSSYIKPIESDKRLFVISQAQTMNLSAQNKLLKTLEEPPNGVHILIGTTTEHAILPTVKSRSKKLEISGFSAQDLFNYLSQDYPDEVKLNEAIACSDGLLGKAIALYLDSSLKTVIDLVKDVFVNMHSSADVLEFSNKITKADIDFNQFISVAELFLRDMLAIFSGKQNLVKNQVVFTLLENAKGFNTGSVLYILEKLAEARKRKKFNANPTMLIEWLLFTILEGKFKWQKL